MSIARPTTLFRVKGFPDVECLDLQTAWRTYRNMAHAQGVTPPPIDDISEVILKQAEQLYHEQPVVRTSSGKYVNCRHTDPDTIDVDDIAWALSGQPRFGGHLRPHRYMVASHCVWVCKAVKREENKLAGLLHDSAEAYLLDLPRPIKNDLPRYREYEEQMLEVIGRKFNVRLTPKPPEVRYYDNLALEGEWEEFMVKSSPVIREVHTDGGYEEFLKLYEKYKRV